MAVHTLKALVAQRKGFFTSGVEGKPCSNYAYFMVYEHKQEDGETQLFFDLDYWFADSEEAKDSDVLDNIKACAEGAVLKDFTIAASEEIYLALGLDESTVQTFDL